MKDKATVIFRRTASGEIIGEIIDESGEIVLSKNFGTMSEEEYRRVLKLMEREFPDIGGIDIIEVSGS